MSDANEKPTLMPCASCAKEGVYTRGEFFHNVSCETEDCINCDARDFTSAEEAIAAWNRRTFPHPIGYALADYLRTGDIVALMTILDQEWEARERAKGELDRALTAEDVKRFGFVESRYGSCFLCKRHGKSGVSIEDHRDGWRWHYTDVASEPVTTLRQFLHLCGLFGIRQSTNHNQNQPEASA